MQEVKFTIPGKPMGKQRPFVTNGNAFTPNKTVNYETFVKLVYDQLEHNNKFFDQGKPVGLAVKAYCGIPKSTSKKNRVAMLEGAILPTKKPDCDNVIKIIADSLNGIAYHDDSQIVVSVVEKYYSENERVEVCLWAVESKNKGFAGLWD